MLLPVPLSPMFLTANVPPARFSVRCDALMVEPERNHDAGPNVAPGYTNTFVLAGSETSFSIDSCQLAPSLRLTVVPAQPSALTVRRAPVDSALTRALEISIVPSRGSESPSVAEAPFTAIVPPSMIVNFGSSNALPESCCSVTVPAPFFTNAEGERLPAFEKT